MNVVLNLGGPIFFVEPFRFRTGALIFKQPAPEG
jgi:hypothetical protein